MAALSSRERLLMALNNEKPDHLPCQVHSWMDYYMKMYLKVENQFQAYECFPGIDWVIYANPRFVYNEHALAKWQKHEQELGQDNSGNRQWKGVIKTPAGILTYAGASNAFTAWQTEHVVKSEGDFELWNKYAPLPEKVDWSPIVEIKDRLKDKGIVRGGFFGFGQGSPWQDFCAFYGTEPAIMATFDKPAWVHHVLESLLAKKLEAIERAGKFVLDLVETGGGAGSSTVISPDIHRQFCLPYDKKQHRAFHAAGTRIVYHLCGGIMPLLEIISGNGADGLETMTPPAMGGDCDLAEATRRIGDKLFFIGGFDQNAGFERGNPEIAAQLVRKCHSACPDGGYICSPSDHFFHGDPGNIQAFVDEANKCIY